MSAGPAPDSFVDRLSNQGRAALLVVLAGLAFLIRVAVSYHAVLGQEYAAFIENDGWYHMRLVDGLVRQFPWRIWQDAYQVHPGGDFVNSGPVFDWIIASVALVLGAGSPSDRLVDLVGAFVPPAIGALIVLAVYGLGRELFSRRAALMAAVSVGVMPGDILIRSLLGFTDHHCAEVLFSTLTLMLLARSLNAGRTERERNNYAWAAGGMLGAYLLTWGAGAMLVAALSVWAALELVVTGGAGSRLRWTAPAGELVRAFALSAVIVAPWVTANATFAYAVLALVGAVAGLSFLQMLARATAGRAHGGRVYYVVLAAMLLAAAAAVAAILAARPLYLEELTAGMARMSPFRTAGAVSEATPLMRSPDWRPIPLWNQYTTSLILALIALPVAMLGDARRQPVRMVLAWTLFTLLATFGQVRFTYYLAVGVALLAGRACDLLLARVPTRRAVAEPAAALLLAILIAAPGARTLVRQSSASTTLTPDWFDALQWMRTNTPEPFGDADAYFRDGLPESPGYGVMGWWDYGYWITRIARRPPATNPRQTQVKEVAQFFTTGDAATASALLDQTGTRYVIVDSLMQMSVDQSLDGAGFFGFIAQTAGHDPSSFCEAMVPPSSATGDALLYCFPEYYETMAVRLYAFGGQAYTPRSVLVVEPGPAAPGQPRHIRRETVFSSYEDALAFVEMRPAGERRIASKDLLASPVPVMALPQMARVYRSVGMQRATGPSLVQIYEYRPQRAP